MLFCYCAMTSNFGVIIFHCCDHIYCTLLVHSVLQIVPTAIHSFLLRYTEFFTLYSVLHGFLPVLFSNTQSLSHCSFSYTAFFPLYSQIHSVSTLHSQLHSFSRVTLSYTTSSHYTVFLTTQSSSHCSAYYTAFPNCTTLYNTALHLYPPKVLPDTHLCTLSCTAFFLVYPQLHSFINSVQYSQVPSFPYMYPQVHNALSFVL